MLKAGPGRHQAEARRCRRRWRRTSTPSTSRSWRSARSRTLPGSLGEAIEELKADELIQEALGAHVYERFVEAKTIEWNEYRTYVSPWELERYLD